MMPRTARSTRYYSLRDLIDLTGISRSTLLRWEGDKVIPRRVILGPRMLAWKRSEIDAWLAERDANHRKRV